MRSLLFITISIVLHALGAAADRPDPDWAYRHQLFLANGANTVNNQVSYVNDTLPPVFNMSRPFTITGWLRASDQLTWRTFVSIESPGCHTSLLNVALPTPELVPNPATSAMEIYFAYMKQPGQDAVSDRENVYTKVIAPGPNQKFHFAIVRTRRQFQIFVNGKLKSTHTVNGQIFNPDPKHVVLASTKYNNSRVAQWRGLIHDVEIFYQALDEDEVNEVLKSTRRDV